VNHLYWGVVNIYYWRSSESSLLGSSESSLLGVVNHHYWGSSESSLLGEGDPMQHMTWVPQDCNNEAFTSSMAQFLKLRVFRYQNRRIASWISCSKKGK